MSEQGTSGYRRPGHTALGTWSGGRFMHFGEAIDEDRWVRLMTPGADIDTVITADAYGAGEADRLLGRALAGIDRGAYSLVGAIGHDVYDGARAGAKGYARFTHPDLRGPEGYADYVRAATERSLERCGVDRFDVLLLHNPDRIGYSHEAVWKAMQAVRDEGLTSTIGIAPGPANGFTLDLLHAFERYGELMDWAMVILNPFEPWPGGLVLDAARRHEVSLITRVVDYGGMFWGDVQPGHEFGPRDHRTFRPAGWVERGAAKLEQMLPIAERHGLSPIGLASAWNLAQPPVVCVAPTIIQEVGAGATTVEDKRAQLAAVPAVSPLSRVEVQEIGVIGDNAGSMALKGASPQHEGDELPDRWALTPELAEVGRRWGIEAERDLALSQR